MKSYTFALLVDGENANPKDFPGVICEIEKKGYIALKRVYADWTQPHQSGWKSILHETGARPVHQFNYGKDSADHALIMDTIELIMSTPRLDAVCIVSSDGGYHALAQRVREKGLYVMGVGKRNTPERLRRACHHFVYTDLLEKEDDVPEQKVEMTLDDMLIKAYQAAEVDGSAVYLGALGSQLKKIDPAFDPRSYSFSTLKGLVKANSHLFDIESETQNQFFIRLKAGCDFEQSEGVAEGTVNRWLNRYGFIDTDHGPYFFSKININLGQRENKVKEGSRVRFSVYKKPDPSADASADRNGKAKDVLFLT